MPDLSAPCATWTPPFHGIQHLGPMNDRQQSRVSVSDYAGFCLLHCWFPGCGFSPIETSHDDVAEARAAGELYLKTAP